MDILTLAKSLITHDKEIQGKIENAVAPADEELMSMLGNKEYCRYMNYNFNGIPLLSVEDGLLIHYDNKYTLQSMDIVEITGTASYNGYYEITKVDDDLGVFVIKKPFISDEIGIIKNRKMHKIQMAHAWLVCYFSTFTIQELKKDKVLIATEEFGEGDTKSYLQTQIKTLRMDYLRNAQLLLGKLTIKGN